MSMGPQVPPAASFAWRSLCAILRLCVTGLAAFSLHATAPPLATWLSPRIAPNELVLAPLVAGPLLFAAAVVGSVLVFWAVLRHADARRAPFGVPLVLLALVGCYVWPPAVQPVEASLLASAALPIVAACAALLEMPMRRLPRRELATASMLLLAAVLHLVAWWSLLSLTAAI